MNMDWKDTLKALKESGDIPAGDNNPDNDTHASVTGIQANAPRPRLHIFVERKGRHGKTATIITGIPDEAAAEALTRFLKQRLGTGGSHRGDEILIQGDCRDKCVQLLKQQGWEAR